MPQTMIGRGNMLYDWLIQVPALVWSSLTLNNQTAELTATIPGLVVGDYVDMYLSNQAMPTNLTSANIRVSASNTVAVTFVAAGAVTVPPGPWLINISRPESPGNLPISAA